MGAAVFMIDNWITSPDMVTVTSERAGQVGLAVKAGLGTATLNATGPYTGANPGQYIVQIDSVAAGNNIGQATFRWRPTSTATWTAQGVATSSSPVLLETGLAIAWATGGGTDLVANDYWTITVDKPYGKARLLDLDRDTEWRTADSVDYKYLTIDLGSAKQVDAVALLDTNLVVAPIGIFGSNTSGALWSTPTYSQTPYITGNFVHYTAGAPTFRWWGIALYVSGHPDGYLRIGDLYLGAKTVFANNFDRSWGRGPVAAVFGPTGALRTARGVWAESEQLDLSYKMMTTADRAKAVAMFRKMYSPATGTVRPVILNPDLDDPTDVSAYELDAPELPIVSPYVNFYEWQLRLRQRPRVARSGA